MKKIVTFGVFDYFHLGHLRLFKQCKTYADYLVVAVQDGDFIKKFKPDSKTLYTTKERVEMIEALACVNEVVVYAEINVNTIEKIEFDILALGEDHCGERFDRIEQWCYANGKEVVRLKRTQGICSAAIKEQKGI